MELQVNKIKDLDTKIDNLRNKGKTDTSILDFLSKNDADFDKRVKSSRNRFSTDQAIKNDRDLINFVSERVTGKMPTIKSIPLASEQPEKMKPFTERVGEDLKVRGEALKDTFKRSGEDLNPLSVGIRNVGDVIGGVGDVVGESIISAASYLPEPIKKGAASAVSNILETPIGKFGIEAAKKGIEKYADFKLEHPDAARDIESVANIASIFPIEKAFSTGGRAALKGIGRVIPKAKAVTKSAEVIVDTSKSLVSKSKTAASYLKEGIETKVKNVAVNKKAKRILVERIKKSVPKVQDAVKSGIDIKDANIISNLNRNVLKKGEEAIDIAKKVVLGDTKRHPKEVMGKEFLNKYRKVENLRKSAGARLGEYTKNIKNIKPKDARFTIFNRIKEVPGLEGLTAKLTNKGYVLDFTNTTLSRNKTAQKEILSTWNDAAGRKALGMHNLRQELFEDMGRKSATMIKKIEGTDDKAMEAIRKGLSDILDNSNSQYKSLNSKFVVYENSLKKVRRALKPVEGANDEIIGKRLSQLARRLTSNADADVSFALNQIEGALKTAGIKSDIDLEELQELLNIIVKIFNVEKSTGFAKQIEGGISKAIPISKRDLLSKVVSETLENTADIRQTPAVIQEALENLIRNLVK